MSCPTDSTFGPAVSGCRHNFDFTTRFEDIVLSLIPSSCFIVLALARICVLARPTRYRSSASGASLEQSQHLGLTAYGFAKLVFAAAYTVLCLATLIVTLRRNPSEPDAVSKAALSLALVSSALIPPLSWLEHVRSKRPSFLLGIYLFLTLLFDIVQTRTRWLVSTNWEGIVVARLSTAAAAVKFILMILEGHKPARNHHLSSEETAGPFNLAAYTWLYGLYFKGYRNILKVDDLPNLDQALKTETITQRLSANAGRNKLTARFSLTLSLARSLLGPLAAPILPRLALVGFRFCQPFLVHSVLDHMEHYSPDEPAWRNAGFGFIGASVFIYFGVAISTAFYWYCHERFISMTRGGLVAGVYRRLIQLRTTDVNDSAAVTLMSTDIERIRFGMLNLHEFWAVPIEVALASWLLYNQLGAAFVAPLVVVIFCVACSSVLNKYTGSRQRQWMDRIQTRVSETAKVLSNVKQLKVSGLAHPVEDSIQQLRDGELKAASKFRRLYVSNMAFGFAPMALCPVITFAVTARNLDTRTIFTSLAYLILLANPLGELFGEIPYLLAAFTSIERIQGFLCKEAQPDNRLFANTNSSDSDNSSEKPTGRPRITIDKARLGWTKDEDVFESISIDVHASALTMLVGPVGSGKSTICKALLSEVPYANSGVNISTAQRDFRAAFCEQVPFISNTSIRNNIIGASPFEEARYQEVVDSTVLNQDLQSLSFGDDTVVGSGGTTLSGGQKQRVAMARALYHDARFCVFDDSLSGLDTDTELEVFMRVFGPDGVLRRRGSTVLLATHNVRHLPLADHIVVLDTNGMVTYEGNYLGLIAAGVRRQSQQFDACIDTPSVTMKPAPPKPKEKQMDLGETEKDAVVTSQNTPELNDGIATITGLSFLSNKDRMTGDSTVYHYYLASLGKLAMIAFIVFGIGWGFFYNFGYIWLRFWSGDTSESHSRSYYIGLYGFWQAGGLLSVILCYWTSYTMMARVSGSKLHRSALRSVIYAPLSFTTATDVGVITNLFSQDMTLIDNELPVAITNLALDICNALGIAAVIATSSPFLVISYPVLLVSLFFIQKFYLRTARQLRLLDLEAKGPLYTHFLDTSRGLATIRAFDWARDHVKVAIELLDASQKPAYLLAMVQRWLLFVLQCIVAILAILVVTLATQGSRSQSTGFTGASLVALMTFGEILNFIIRWWTQLETSIGAVTRLKALNDKVPAEGSKDETSPHQEGWPLHGGIVITNVTAAYQDFEISRDEEASTSGPGKAPHPVVENLTLSINPGERVAICGRSGSGKSSTILLLLRMLDPLSSCSTGIVIDDVPLHTVDRQAVRERIIAMPQDPVFLPGEDVSIKGQLDPLSLSTEAECRSVLGVVGLGHLTDDCHDLNAIVLQVDSLSGGQKQLFNLARTILRGRARARSHRAVLGDRVKPGGVLLLDEVSASVDHQTEQTMMKIIRQEFGGYTIIMVSHRLDMVMDFDTVLVMEEGRVVERGEPRILAVQETSRFGQLWAASGRRAHEGR